MTELLLAGGTLVDGTGAEPRRADVVVRGDRIGAVVEPGTPVPAARRVDVTGRVVCPGFVDIHTHSDLTLVSNPLAHSKIRQGVTTEIVGNCGLGVAPVTATNDADIATLRDAVAYLDVDTDVDIDWRTVAEYLDAVAGASVHVGTLVGHIPVRAAVIGFDERPATTTEIDRMCEVVAEALADGALGLSTGLMYPPLHAARTDELLALAEVVADRDGLFAWHLRDYADDLVASAAEAVRVAEQTGCRTQISHLVAVGERNWGRVADVLAMAGGLVGVDVYPYLAGNAPLSQLSPDQTTLPWTEITVASGAPQDLLGRTIADLAAAQGRAASAVVTELVATHGNHVIMTAGGRSEKDLHAVLTHDASVIASDGMALPLDGAGFPHPRSFGCFPRALTGSGLPLATAVHKCTAAPARRVGLTDRGTVAPGQLADLVVLNMEQLADHATFTEPRRYPSGVEHVIVAGTMVVEDGEVDQWRPRRVGHGQPGPMTSSGRKARTTTRTR